MHRSGVFWGRVDSTAYAALLVYIIDDVLPLLGSMEMEDVEIMHLHFLDMRFLDKAMQFLVAY